jgi:hypothetical protein
MRTLRRSVMALPAGQVRERSTNIAEFAGQGEQSLLVLPRGFVPRDRLPRDEQCVGIGQLPDVPPTPMPDRPPCTETRELLQSLGGNVGLSDVHDMSAGHPLGFENLNVDCRVPPLEMTTRIDVNELRVGRGVPVHHVGRGTAGYLHQSLGAQFVPCAPTDKPGGLEVWAPERRRKRCQRGHAAKLSTHTGVVAVMAERFELKGVKQFAMATRLPLGQRIDVPLGRPKR